MAKLIITLAFVGAFAVFLAWKFAFHHAKKGIREARKAVDAIDIGTLAPVAEGDDDFPDRAPETRESG